MADADSSTDRETVALRQLEFERYKAGLDFRKFIWGSVVAGITIALIPPFFQLATAGLEYVKSEAARKMAAQQFRDGYVKDFLETALKQDIEIRLRFADYFAAVSSEKNDWVKYREELGKLREAKKREIDELERKWLALSSGDTTADANEAKRHLDWAYAEVGYAAPNRSTIANPRAPVDIAGPAPSISLTSLPEANRATAQLILDKFAAAGFGPFQQVAALANAIAESGLDPKARTSPPQNSAGLFLLNMRSGLGTGLTLEQLMDPNVNIDIILKEAQKYPAFAAATSLDEAVAIFVRNIERPANAVGETLRRQQIARQFLRS